MYDFVIVHFFLELLGRLYEQEDHYEDLDERYLEYAEHLFMSSTLRVA